MTNAALSDQFTLLSKLMDIHGENSFKVKNYSIAAYNIDKTMLPFANMTQQEIYNTKGIGSSIGSKIEELLATQQLAVLEQLIGNTPLGILEMMHIKGLGPKKIITIWKELEIETIGELLYACNENRLLLYKGFGAKNQQAIKESIEFYLNAKGSFLYSQVVAIEPLLTSFLTQIFSEATIQITGTYLRQIEVIDFVEYVVHYPTDVVLAKMATIENIQLLKNENDILHYKLEEIPLKICIYPCTEIGNTEQLFNTSGAPEFVTAFKNSYKNIEYRSSPNNNDAIIFEQANLQYVPPYLRDTATILSLAQQHKIPKPITINDIKGMVHNHSNWSDGTNTIAEMAEACIAKGWEYLVISDHSKSAYYANGLSEQRIKEQHIEIELLNKKYAPFKILKSIECDILNDGSLDYSDSILSTFDMVIASVHSNLKMSEEKAMQRLLGAIENPYTTILGHLTGRLLLSRPPYPINYDVIIDACASNHVVIELNAHPSRLDMDWRYIQQTLAQDVLISINPDAHNIEGFGVIENGLLAAQKAMVQPHQNLSSFSLRDLEEFLYETKERKLEML